MVTTHAPKEQPSHHTPLSLTYQTAIIEKNEPLEVWTLLEYTEKQQVKETPKSTSKLQGKAASRSAAKADTPGVNTLAFFWKPGDKHFEPQVFAFSVVLLMSPEVPPKRDNMTYVRWPPSGPERSRRATPVNLTGCTGRWSAPAATQPD